MVRLLLKLGCDPNLQGKAMDTRRGGATALDSCVFGLSRTVQIKNFILCKFQADTGAFY